MTLTNVGLERDLSTDGHGRATRRLEDAMGEQERQTTRYEQAVGTPQELDAYMRLREARRHVTACDRWLHWVDDEDSVQSPPADDVPLEDVLGH